MLKLLRQIVRHLRIAFSQPPVAGTYWMADADSAAVGMICAAMDVAATDVTRSVTIGSNVSAVVVLESLAVDGSRWGATPGVVGVRCG
jgi:hypothetical protein